MRLCLLALTWLNFFSAVLSSYEEYIILPVNSNYCQDHPFFRRFSLSRQMSFVTGVYNSSWNNLLYACKIKVYPNGRLLHYSYPEGHTSYWFHRLKISINFTSCNDFLTVGFIPEEITQPSLLPYEQNITCTSKFPQIIDSKHRIISLVWYTESGSIDEINSQLDVQMSAYMRFEGSFNLIDKMRRCEVGSGFWCGNQTAVCVYGQMRCDQADGCFDGGTDEIGCPPVRNYTYVQPRRPVSSWSVYLPWTALGLIPLILIFALGLICAPRKSLDGLDEDDDDGDESQEGEGLKTVFSPMTSSSAASPSLSASSSPRSIQSIAVCSNGEKVIVCDSELTRSLSHPSLSDMVRASLANNNNNNNTNENHKRQSYQPGYKVDMEEENNDSYHQQKKSNYNLENDDLPPDYNRDTQNCMKEHSVGYFNEILKPPKSRAVTFQLPEKFDQKSVTDLYQEMNNSEVKKPTTHESHVSDAHQQITQPIHTPKQGKANNKYESRAIPASFEMAALRMRSINNARENKTNHSFNLNCENGSNCPPNTFETVGQCNNPQNHSSLSLQNNSEHFISNEDNLSE
uniref:CUB domain-containing protein n=1 Tax=Trichobilharzia regenti TaxID=157069 RepID=A0AA85JV18_TRIRE|nr:unnamed protein product [Trichobilharzia regenti]